MATRAQGDQHVLQPSHSLQLQRGTAYHYMLALHAADNTYLGAAIIPLQHSSRHHLTSAGHMGSKGLVSHAPGQVAYIHTLSSCRARHSIARQYWCIVRRIVLYYTLCMLCNAGVARLIRAVYCAQSHSAGSGKPWLLRRGKPASQRALRTPAPCFDTAPSQTGPVLCSVSEQLQQVLHAKLGAHVPAAMMSKINERLRG